MEKELNIAAILKDKPYYSKLYDVARDINVFYGCQVGDDCEIHCYLEEGGFLPYHYNGTLIGFPKGMQILKPSKEMQDWSKFAWKKGDVLYAESIDNYCIFNKFADDEYTTFEGKFLFDARNLDVCNSNYFNESTDEFVKVSDDDAKIILSNLASLLGGKLNLSTLEIDKQKQEFKDGDIVTIEETSNRPKAILVYKGTGDIEHCLHRAFYIPIDDYLEIKNDRYFIKSRFLRFATDSEKHQLFAALEKENKAWDAENKAIVDLPKKREFKPMDLCLMRDFNETWKLCQFGFMEKGYVTGNALYNAVGGNTYEECIPYNDQTKHLLGTTDDWKGGEG